MDAIEQQYRDGIITRTEKYNKVVDVWTKATNDVTTAMLTEIATDVVKDPVTGREVVDSSLNPIFMMSNSGSRGKPGPNAAAGRHARPHGQALGEIIETPITSSFREGLSVLQYFTSTTAPGRGWRIRPSRPPTRGI